MKLVNVILAVMILGLAGTAIYFASQLHQKRYLIKARGDHMRENIVQFIERGDEMIKTTSKETLASNLGKLHHTAEPSAVSNALNELRVQFDAFAAYQKTCLTRIGEMAEDLTIPGYFKRDKAKGETTIKLAGDELEKGARALNARDNAIIAHIVQLGGEFSQPLSSDNLGNVNDQSAMETACNTISDNITGLWTRIGTYESSINRIADLASASKPRYDGDYQAGFTAIQDNLAKIDPRITELNDGVSGANAKIKSVNDEIKNRDEQITALNVDVTEREKKVQDLSNVLTLPAPTPPKWTDADQEIVTGAIKGEVTDVSPEWAFVVINCGSANKVRQPNTDNDVAAPVPGGIYNMVVSRVEGEMPKYVGKVTISRVEANQAVVNIDGKLDKENGIRVGDKAFFIAEEVKKIVSDKAPPKSETPAETETVDFDE